MANIMELTCKVTDEGRELYREVICGYPNYEAMQRACEFYVLEMEDRDKPVDLGWLGMLIYEAGMIAGKREERAKRHGIRNNKPTGRRC